MLLPFALPDSRVQVPYLKAGNWVGTDAWKPQVRAAGGTHNVRKVVLQQKLVYRHFMDNYVAR